MVGIFTFDSQIDTEEWGDYQPCRNVPIMAFVASIVLFDIVGCFGNLVLFVNPLIQVTYSI